MEIQRITGPNVLNGVWSYFKNRLSQTIKFKALTKDDLIDIINDNIQSHQNILDSLTSLSVEELNNLFTKSQQKPGGKKYLFLFDWYTNLTQEARRLEFQKHLSSIIVANRTFLRIMEDINEKIDQIIEEDKITVFDVKISALSLLGLLEMSYFYSNYSSCLFTTLVKIINESEDTIPKYRLEFLKTNVNVFSDITNMICNKSGKFEFLKYIDIVRKKGIDYKVYSSNGISLDNIAKAADYPTVILKSISFIPRFFNIFEMIGNAWIDFKHQRYLKRKEIKEWMESHVALLKLELANKDVNDPEYIKLQKIIENYERRITLYDKKINEYLGE